MSCREAKTGWYGGIEIAVCDSEILATIRNGTRKKTTSQRNGTQVAMRRVSGVGVRSRILRARIKPKLLVRHAQGSRDAVSPIRPARSLRQHDAGIGSPGQ